MIYLADNDIVGKLGHCDLLDEALSAFDVTHEHIYVISTLKYRFGIGSSRDKAVLKHGEDVVARVTNFLSRTNEVTQSAPDDEDRLDDIVGIDPGEAILLSATSLFTDFLLLTGDKRCIKTLASAPECETIARRVQGRVVCFEQVLCRIISRFGFRAILPKVVPALHCDTGLRAAFGSGMASGEENAIACLWSYIRELRGLPIDLLLTDPSD